MQNHKIIQKIGKIALTLGLGFFSSIHDMKVSPVRLGELHASTQGSSIEFSAQVDQNKIGLDETVTLRLLIQSDGRGNVSQPHFNAPDFEVIQQSSSVSVRSEYDSTAGRFSTVNQTELVRILQPKKKGKFKIAGIEVRSDGKVISAPDLLIEVGDPVGPSQAQSRSVRGGNPSHQRMPQMNSQDELNDGSAFVLRAEVDQGEVYKGEQIMVSYYLYYQGKVLNLEVKKFPEFIGFLREDLALPVMTQRLSPEVSSLNGVPYYKALLLKYALYPLQEGKLSVDPLALKVDYISNRQRNRFDSDEDHFFMNFFQPITPQVGTLKSDPKTVNVLSLPEAGKPVHFSGGVGEFSVMAAVNKYEVHAHDALSLTVKVDGQGNLTAMKEPHIVWPPSIDVYDSKAKVVGAQANGAGGSKVFEYLLIPRNPGKFTLPSIQFDFFSAKRKSYYTQATDPISIEVLQPLPGSQATSTQGASVPAAQGNQKIDQKSHVSSINQDSPLKGIKPPQREDFTEFWHPLWRVFYWASSVLFAFFLIIVLKDALKQNKLKLGSRGEVSPREQSDGIGELRRLRESLRKKQMMEDELSLVCQQLFDFLMRDLNERLSLRSHSLSRAELRELFLQNPKSSTEEWTVIEQVFEYLDQIKYSGLVQKEELQQKIEGSLELLEKIKRSG